jgi:1-acyl-sn-glycerol-3-phosphate acyltransferase
MTAPDPAVPRVSNWLVRGFVRYCRRYVGKHFHAVRVSKQSSPVPADGRPLIFVLNHPAWWDVIVGAVLSTRFPGYRHYAPIEAPMLQKYRIFARLGIFGVEPTPRGAAVFLRTARAIFAQPYGALWVTAQGHFADVRERPIVLRPGVGAVAARLDRGAVVPVAVEYPFWDERTPEALVRFGEPLSIPADLDARTWTERIAIALGKTMDALAAEAVRREPAAFDVLIGGRVGVGGVYDLWRQAKGVLTGRRVDVGHGRRVEAVP